MSERHLSDAELQSVAEADQAEVTLPPHLAACATCRDGVAAYHRIGRAVSLTPRLAPPSDFTASLMARLPAEPPPLSTDDLLAVALAAVAALAAAVLFTRAGGVSGTLDLLRRVPGLAITEAIVAASLNARDQVPLLLFLAAAALVLGAALRRVLSHSRRILA